MNPKYEIIIYWSETDSRYIAEIPELSGAMADGASYQEALMQAEIIIEQWITIDREIGRTIPEPKGKLSYA
jgi:predicted RNase H-like HicB family nuclease